MAAGEDHPARQQPHEQNADDQRRMPIKEIPVHNFARLFPSHSLSSAKLWRTGRRFPSINQAENCLHYFQAAPAAFIL
jgi:DNA polymerase III delta prime subunit